MWGKDCPHRLMHHVWCPPPIYTRNVVYRIGKDRRGGGKAASGVGTRGYWQRPNTMALPSRETANIYNTSHLANVYYSRVTDPPMFTKDNILKEKGTGGIAPCILRLGNRLRWVVSLAFRPLCHGREDTMYALGRRETGWSWYFREEKDLSTLAGI